MPLHGLGGLVFHPALSFKPLRFNGERSIADWAIHVLDAGEWPFGPLSFGQMSV